ncbi:hypothetical protein [Hymenobacter sp.]|uniref:hypothetical protein n=1 Tax=Hymenobacter sp. TaxID=1898978 RepID=UPI00286A04E7|nr:hypothetical protein [Hymenobacter sp.]
MSKPYLFASVFLFWVALYGSLLRVHLAVLPVPTVRVPTFRSILVRSTPIVQASTPCITTHYN